MSVRSTLIVLGMGVGLTSQMMCEAEAQEVGQQGGGVPNSVLITSTMSSSDVNNNSNGIGNTASTSLDVHSAGSTVNGSSNINPTDQCTYNASHSDNQYVAPGCYR